MRTILKLGTNGQLVNTQFVHFLKHVFFNVINGVHEILLTIRYTTEIMLEDLVMEECNLAFKKGEKHIVYVFDNNP